MADKSKSYGDKDIATNLLVTLKHMKAELNTFTQEASNDELFDLSAMLFCLKIGRAHV